MEIEMKTNIKNLPEGRNYFTERGYSQSYPWVEVSRSPSGKTVKLARVFVEKDHEWVPNFIVGGFCAHCDNQQDQTWLFKSFGHEGPIPNFIPTITVRLTKKGWARKGVRFDEGRAVEFYDYNF
jgi:hypothetical protein